MTVRRYAVLLTAGAEGDIESIRDYIAGNDSPPNAERVVDGLFGTLENLAQLPERRSYPKELLALGIKEYRQVFCKPYRIIYRVQANRVIVYLVADGRRDMQSLLARRLLGAPLS